MFLLQDREGAAADRHHLHDHGFLASTAVHDFIIYPGTTDNPLSGERHDQSAVVFDSGTGTAHQKPAGDQQSGHYLRLLASVGAF